MANSQARATYAAIEYRNGATVASIAEALGVTKAPVYSYLKRASITPRVTARAAKRHEAILSLYATGLPGLEISRKLNLSIKCVKLHLWKEGLTP